MDVDLSETDYWHVWMAGERGKVVTDWLRDQFGKDYEGMFGRGEFVLHSGTKGGSDG